MVHQKKITDLWQNFGSKVGNGIVVLLKWKGPDQSDCAYDIYDIVRKHFLMLYTHLIERNTVGNTNSTLLRCFLFIWIES